MLLYFNSCLNYPYTPPALTLTLPLTLTLHQISSSLALETA